MADVTEVLNKAENKEELKSVLSDHFDAVKQPVSVSLGLHLRGQTVEDVVNLLRKDGIKAVPYYDEKVQDDLSCFVVDGTGVRSPFMSPEEAVRATADIAQIMFKNKIETSRAMPITRASLVPAVSEKYTGNVIDIAKNNPSIPNVKETLSEYLKYASEKMPAIEVPTQKSHDSIYSGRLFADGYALTPHRRYRDCVYGTNKFSEALTYSQAANKGGLHLEEVDGHSYGFIIETKQQPKQAFYDMAGAERPFATREERQTAKRKENRDDYETLVLEDRNPEIAKYLRVDDKVVQIADENGFFNNDGIDWEKFASLHKPRDTNEPNDYLVARVNKQMEEFPVFAYEKQNNLEEYQPTADIKGYAYRELIRENADGYEINNASFHSLKLSENLCKTNLTGNISLVNCTIAENQTLELAHCNGDISFAHMTYDKKIHLPEQCEYLSLSCVKLPQCDELDLSHTKSQNVTLEDSDLTAAKSLKLPQSDELKLRYDVKMPESLDLSGVKTIIFDQTAKLDLSQTKELKATGFDIVMRSRDENNPINRLVDTYAMKILSGLPEWNHSEANSDTEVVRQKLNFAAKMTELKASLNEYNIQDEKQALRAVDLVVAQHVPDEHVEIVIDGEEHRAADDYISKSPELQYKIPPQENNNLINSDEKFDKAELFTLVAPSKPDEIANILVAEKQIDNHTVGIVAVDSFMIEYSNEKEYEKVNKIADYVLEQSKHWNDVIFDVRGNGGGDATIIKQIGERMADKKLEYADKIEVINPELAIQGGPPDRYEQKAGDKTFTGNVYVLQDRGDSSAGDGAIWMLRQMDNCTTIGENTHGAFAGGDVKKHQMEGGTLLLGNTYRERTMPDGTKVEEGKGIPPDVKSESKDAYSQAMSLITQKSQERENSNKISISEPSFEHYQAFLTACKKMQDYVKDPSNPDDVSKNVSKGFIFAKEEFLSLSEEEFKTKIVDEYAQRSQDGAKKPEHLRFIMVGDEIAGYINVRALPRDEFDERQGLKTCKKWDYISENGARACISDVLLPEYRGKGVIGKATKLFFEELKEKGINEVSATVLKDNSSSNSAHEKMIDNYGGKAYEVYGDPDGKGVQYYNRYIISTDTSGRQKDNYKEKMTDAWNIAFDEKTGEFVEVNDKTGEHRAFQQEQEFKSEPEKPSKAPEMKFNPTSMEFEYANPKLQEIAERRRELNHTKQDILALKERIAKQGLEEIGLEGKMGQTGNSRATNSNEAVTETHKKVAESQIEDLKPFIKNYIEQLRSK